MILVFNPGSSSIKYKLYKIKLNRLFLVAENSITRIDPGKDQFIKSYLSLIKDVKKFKHEIKFVAYRVVYGDNLSDGAEADNKTLNIIKMFEYIAPLHNINVVLCIEHSKKHFIKAKHKCYFDTTYFKNLPGVEQIIPIDLSICQKFRLRRNGYHGISHQYAYDMAKPSKNEKVITIHLGAGCSATAIIKGKPIATSMGYTPMEGLTMQTRCGSIDPGVIVYLAKHLGVNKLNEILNKKSGLAGLTGTSGNMLDILYLAGEKIEDPDYLPPKNLRKNNINYKKSKLALDYYVNSIKKYIGSYSALMGGIDRVIFTGKIGAGSSIIRKKILKDLNYLKIKNVDIIIPDEELAIANKVKKEFPK